MRFASTSSATCRSATSRSAWRFSMRKKFSRAVCTRACGVDAPSRRRVISASGVMSTSTTSSASASSRSGNVSRTRTPVSSATWSLSDSRCWTLTVVNTSMPGLEELRDVLVALAVLEPRGIGVGELVDEAELGRPLPGARADPSPAPSGCGGRRRGGAGSPAPLPARPSPPCRASRARRRRRRARRRPPRDPPAACGRSCRPPPPCPGRSCSGRPRLRRRGPRGRRGR